MDSVQDTITPRPKQQQRKGPYIPTESEIAAAISVLQYVPRSKTIRPTDTYTDLKWPCEVVSGEYISAKAMTIACERLGFLMKYIQPTRHSALINVRQRTARELRQRAEAIRQKKWERGPRY